jgi:4-amino-4-deoxy-L-arabinose transferase-like glycosyltransferase
MRNVLNKTVNMAVVTLCVYYIATYLIISTVRLFYPFELEWMEGGMVSQVIWILQENQLYVEPTVQHVPFIYPPLYYWLAAFLSKLIGTGFFPLRLISIASSIGIFYLIYLFLRNETNSKYYAIAGVGLFAATYKLSGSWFDIARVDTLFILLLFLAVYIYSRAHDSRLTVLSSIIFCCSFFTKQSALAFVIVFLLVMSTVEFRKALTCLIVFLVLSASIGLILNIASDGWFYFYVFELPQSHQFRFNLIPLVLKTDYVPLIIMIGIIAVWIIKHLQLSRDTFKKLNRLPVLCIALLAGMCILSISSRLHEGGYTNVNIPAYLSISLVGTISFAKLDPKKSNLLLLLLILQLIILLYNPFDQIPTKADKNFGNKFIEAVSKFNGNVLITAHGYYGHLSGKGTYAHGVAISDIMRTEIDESVKKSLKKTIKDELDNSISAVITSKECDGYGLDPSLKNQSKSRKINYPDSMTFVPITGCVSRPTTIYLLPK